MLHAILSGKAGRVSVEGGLDQSWREVFRKREDLLTAVFFGRIRYLSPEAEQKVLSILVGDELAARFGDVREVIFWPKLGGLAHRNHVEPDVILRFEDTLLMVEVKPPFGGNQNVNQWEEQIEGLITQRDLDDAVIDVPSAFHFLALGKNLPDRDALTAKLARNYAKDGLESATAREWEQVFGGVWALAEEDIGRDAAIYADWIEALDLFGSTARPLPFTDMVKFNYAISEDVLRLLQLPHILQEEIQIYDVDWSGLAGLCRETRFEGMELWK